MNDINVNEVLDKLIELTKKNILTWEYLDCYKVLCNELNYEGVSPTQNYTNLKIFTAITSSKKMFDSDNSFVTKINDNYIILYCNIDNNDNEKTLDERLIFMLVPRTFKDVFRCSSDGNLLRLHSLVKSYFPSAKDIANDILNL